MRRERAPSAPSLGVEWRELSAHETAVRPQSSAPTWGAARPRNFLLRCLFRAKVPLAGLAAPRSDDGRDDLTTTVRAA